MFMKKLLTILCICLASSVLSTTRAVEPQKMLTLSGELYYALDVDKFYLASLEEIGSDAQITIYNDDFSVKEQFTVKGVISYEIEKDDNGKDRYKRYKSGVRGIESTIDPDSEIIATRGLFTKDGLWTVAVDKNDIVDNYPRFTKCVLYSSNSKKVCELPTEGWDRIWLSRFTTGTPYYCTTIDVGTLDAQFKEDYQYIIWLFEDVNGVVTPKAVASNVKAYPNPLPSGTPLTIDLDREADSNTILTITDLDGRQVYRERVRPGKANVQVSPKFSRGLHIYTVIYSDGESFSGKVAAE